MGCRFGLGSACVQREPGVRPTGRSSVPPCAHPHGHAPAPRRRSHPRRRRLPTHGRVARPFRGVQQPSFGLPQAPLGGPAFVPPARVSDSPCAPSAGESQRPSRRHGGPWAHADWLRPVDHHGLHPDLFRNRVGLGLLLWIALGLPEDHSGAAFDEQGRRQPDHDPEPSCEGAGSDEVGAQRAVGPRLRPRVDDVDVRQRHGIRRSAKECASILFHLDQSEIRLREHRGEHKPREPETASDIDDPARTSDLLQFHGRRGARQADHDETVRRRPVWKHALIRIDGHRRERSERSGALGRESIVRGEQLDMLVKIGR